MDRSGQFPRQPRHAMERSSSPQDRYEIEDRPGTAGDGRTCTLPCRSRCPATRRVFRSRLESRLEATQIKQNRGEAAAADRGRQGQPYPEFSINSFYDHVALQRLLIVNLLRLTPSSTPVPLPVSDSDTSPLVRACASDDGPAPAAAPALA